jgi:L-aspartate oxidase
MWEGVGIERTASSLRRALEGLERLGWLGQATVASRSGFEVRNLLLVATAVANAALERRGSVGCHFRRDYQEKGAHWRRHIILKARPPEEPSTRLRSRRRK